MSKRKRFVITSIVLALGFVAVQAVPDNIRILSILGLSLLTVILFVWSLWEGLSFDMTLLSLVLPFLYTLGVGFFWFLLPTTILARIPVVILYGFGIYGLCLTSNIYTVSTIRTIALLRAARGVGFILTLLTFFLLFDTLLSLRWWVYYVSPLAFLISLPIYLQSYWSFNLEKKLSKDLLAISIVASLIMAEVTAVMFFWPVSVVVGSLFLTVTAYIMLGLGQAYLEERLFSQTVRDYLLVGFAVFIGMLFATHWR